MAKMKLLSYCMVAVLMATVSNGAVDVERTVKQVQTILQANSQLPRLSRDEIIQLLNDIKAEDAKSKSSSIEQSKEKQEVKTIPYNNNDNEVNSAEQPDIYDNIAADQNNVALSAPASTEAPIETTTKNEPTVMVVLPYTPRDGATLQELYTRPPRTEVVPESKVTPKPFILSSSEQIQQTLKNNAQIADKLKVDFPAELQAFLDSRGLKSKPGQDPFLLPLEGFKPLPPARVVDGSIQLPENILLAYDLISPSSEAMATAADIGAINSLSPTNFQYDPLHSEFPFELDTSPSDMKKSVLPLDLPKHRNTKSTTVLRPNYEPIDYDSVKVIPLQKGPSPLEEEKVILENDLGKRQINITVQSQVSAASETVDEVTTTPASDSKDAITNAPSASDSDTSADTDTGASIADLEDSFGGAVPAQPGDSELPPPKKNGFYWMLDWNSFLEVGDGDTKVNIRFEPKLGDPQMFLPVNVP